MIPPPFSPPLLSPPSLPSFSPSPPQVHMLDLECFTYLNRALESPLSPIVILASNRGRTPIRGTTLVAAHGLPPDLLPRLLIVPTHPYTAPEIRTIIQTRARLEFSSPVPPTLSSATTDTTTTTASSSSSSSTPAAVPVTPRLATDALDALTLQGSTVSLRYALQLLAPAAILARARGAADGVVAAADVQDATALFMDAGRSAEVLRGEQADLFIA